MEVQEPRKASPGQPFGAQPPTGDVPPDRRPGHPAPPPHAGIAQASRAPAPVDFDTWVRWRRAQVRRRLLEAAAASPRRTVRTRPRDPVEDDLLTHLVVLRWKRALATGEVQRLGARRWRLRV